LADNTPITPGSGETIRTEERGGVKTQVIMLDKGPAVEALDVFPATSAQTSVAGSASSVQLLAATATRLGATIFNDSAATLYLKLGTTASTTSFTVKLITDAYYEVPFGFTGRIDGIWTSATGNARITELTA
jgi:hypothetical protein